MAKKTLINRKKGTEHKVDDADKVLKKYKGVFKEKPATQISDDVRKKEQSLDKAKAIDVKEAKKVDSFKESKSKK